MTNAIQPYRGSYLMPAFERASVAVAGVLAWGRA